MKWFLTLLAAVVALIPAQTLFGDDFTLSRMSSEPMPMSDKALSDRALSDRDIAWDSVINRDAVLPEEDISVPTTLSPSTFALVAQEGYNERDTEFGTGAVASLMGGIGYPRWAFDVNSTTEAFNIRSNVVLAAALNFEVRIIRDLSLFASVEQDIGKDVRARIFTIGGGYNLYYPIANFFEPAEQKAMVFAGLSFGKLDVTKEDFPDHFDSAIGPCAGLTWSAMIETHWEFALTMVFRYLDFKYDNTAPDIISAPSAVGGGSVYALIGVGYRF